MLLEATPSLSAKAPQTLPAGSGGSVLPLQAGSMSGCEAKLVVELVPETLHLCAEAL